MDSMFLQIIIACLPCQNVIYMLGKLFLCLLWFDSETKLILDYFPFDICKISFDLENVMYSIQSCSSILMMYVCLFASNLESRYWLNHDHNSCSIAFYSLVFDISLSPNYLIFHSASALLGSDRSSFNNSVADQQVGWFFLYICWTWCNIHIIFSLM